MSEKSEVKILKTYYADDVTGYSFSADLLDDKEQKVPRINPNTNAVVYIGNQPEWLSERVVFDLGTYTQGENPFCIYNVTEKTPRHIVANLEKMATDGTGDILEYEAFIKKRNPGRYEELMRRRDLEAEVETLREKTTGVDVAVNKVKAEYELKAKQDGDTISKMKERLAKLEGKEGGK